MERQNASCHVKVIDRTELRIGKQCDHVDCAIRSFQKARVMTNVIFDVDEIDGFGLINAGNNSLITNLVENLNNARKLPLLKALPKKTIYIQTPAKFLK